MSKNKKTKVPAMKEDITQTIDSVAKDVEEGGFFYYAYVILRWIFMDLIFGILSQILRFIRWIVSLKWTWRRFAAACITVVVLLFFGDELLYLCTLREQVITVNKLEDQTSPTDMLGHRYMAHTDIESYKIKDARIPFYAWTFASDVYREMREGGTYRVKTGGIRIKWPERWTSFPNILRIVEEIEVEDKVKKKTKISK